MLDRMRHWLTSVLVTSDPGLTRLRTAVTTLATLAITLVVLALVMTVWGQATTSALLGVVVAMMASMAIVTPSLRDRAVTTALLVPSAAIAVTLAVLLNGIEWAGDVVFVLIMVGAVLLRAIGPRGGPIGMVAFMSYFFALFLQATTPQIPALIVSAAIGAVMTFVIAALTRSRHPDHELRRVLGAWGARAAIVMDDLAEATRTGDWGDRARRRTGRALSRGSEAALMVEQHLDVPDEPSGESRQVWSAIGNEELRVRVFDAQLGVERVAALARVAAHEPTIDDAGRADVAAALADLGARLNRRSSLDAPSPRSGGTTPPFQVFDRALDRCALAWRRAWEPRADDADIAPADGDDEVAATEAAGPGAGAASDAIDASDVSDVSDASDDPIDDSDASDAPKAPPSKLRSTARQAAQVGLAGSAAIVVGEALSPDRWFWAVIAAFVVFTGTSTREETLSKGWQRILGTLGGVVVGVVVAALVGDNEVVALILIAVCLFLGFYWVKISSGIMIFFVTTMLALLYGLLGEFSVGLLVLRLEETAAGAAIGIAASYLVLPSGTRSATRGQVAGVLDALSTQLEAACRRLTTPRSTGGDLLDATRALRDALAALRTTSKPFVQGLGGPATRTGTRRTVLVMGACEHHARALGRVADLAAGRAASPQLSYLIAQSVQVISETVGAVREAAEQGNDLSGVSLRSADHLLDATDRANATQYGDSNDAALLLSATRHLRAIDEALREFATERGATTGEPVEAAGASRVLTG